LVLIPDSKAMDITIFGIETGAVGDVRAVLGSLGAAYHWFMERRKEPLNTS